MGLVKPMLIERLRLHAIHRQFASLTTSHLATAIASFVGVAFLARTVSLEQFGRVVFAQATVTTIFIFLDPRLEDAVLRFIPLIHRRFGSGEAADLFRRVLLFDGLLGVVFAILGIVVLWVDAIPLGSAGDREFLMLAVLQLGLQAAMGTAAAGFAITDGLTQMGLIRALVASVAMGLSLGGLFFGGAVWYMAMLALAAGVSTLAVGLLAWRRVTSHFGRPVPLPAGWMREFSVFSLVASLAASVSIGIDTLPLSIIGIVAGPGVLGQFRVGLAPAKLTATAFSPLPTIYFPLLSREAANDEYEKIRSRVLGWTRATIPVALVLGAIAWVTLPWALPLVFGSKFTSSVPVARLLVIAALARGLVAWSKVLALAVGKSGVNLLITMLDAVLLFSATWWIALRAGAGQVALAHLGVAIIVSGVWVKFASSLRGSLRESRPLTPESAP
jgi:O-antigen/teichoic acid export membrane protein